MSSPHDYRAMNWNASLSKPLFVESSFIISLMFMIICFKRDIIRKQLTHLFNLNVESYTMY